MQKLTQEEIDQVIKHDPVFYFARELNSYISRVDVSECTQWTIDHLEVLRNASEHANDYKRFLPSGSVRGWLGDMLQTTNRRVIMMEARRKKPKKDIRVLREVAKIIKRYYKI